ncbi:alpha/beta hydrolase fold-domain-containing protein [Cerioporus squamosus]|nr:alpha/beta hydrolase fold-domain-containing protein [Cerioporus squamosus]
MGYDPELAAALASDSGYTQPQAPPEGVSLVEYARQQANAAIGPFSQYYREHLPDESQYIVSDRRIPVEGSAITLRYVRPLGDPTLPALVWFHGGGYMLGDLDMDDAHLRSISLDLQLATINVDYRLAPEHPFPTAFDDGYAALRWVVNNAGELQIDLRKGFLVGGDSAGGNLAAAVALKARDDPLFKHTPLTGQYLREPVVIFPGAYALTGNYASEFRSFAESTDTPLLNSERVLGSFQIYGGPPEDLRVSPLLAPSHAGLPPAFIQVQQFDPIRDDGIVYEQVLREAGVETKLVKYVGTVHGFHYAFPRIAAAVRVDRDAREGLRWLLGLGSRSGELDPGA